MRAQWAGSVVALVCACGGDPSPAADSSSDATAVGSTTPGSGDPSSPSEPGSSDDGSTGSAPESESSSSGEAPLPLVPGLFAEYFTGYHDIALARVEAGIDHVWALEAPSAELPVDRFSARWTGWLTAPASDTYTIVTLADDGVRVAIDGTVVIDDWIPHFVTRNEGSIALTAGVPVPIVVEYFEADIEASVQLLWSSPTIAESPIDDGVLSTVELSPALTGPKPPYVNPVVPFDCPDPGVLALDDVDPPGFAMACTGGSFPLRFSRDLVTWNDTGVSLLPAGKPSWAANGGRNWAPELHRFGDGLAAYFTSVDGGNTLCIGAAMADTLDGPWIESPAPIAQHDWGVIDATLVMDGGTPWLVYKIDGNSIGQPTPIRARQLAEDGLAFADGSSPTELITNDGGTWEGGVVEAPWVVQRDGTWFMFYSGNVYDHRYRTGVARSSSLLGPWEKHGAPILGNNERWVGPGHGSVVTVNGIDYFVYHAWTNAGDGTNAGGGRHVLVDRIDWVDGWAQIGDGTPSRTRQPWPGDTLPWTPPAVPGP